VIEQLALPGIAQGARRAPTTRAMRAAREAALFAEACAPRAEKRATRSARKPRAGDAASTSNPARTRACGTARRTHAGPSKPDACHARDARRGPRIDFGGGGARAGREPAPPERSRGGTHPSPARASAPQLFGRAPVDRLLRPTRPTRLAVVRARRVA